MFSASDLFTNGKHIMSPLSNEERQRIVEEERVRAEARAKYSQPQQMVVKKRGVSTGMGCLIIILALIFIPMVISALMNSRDKAEKAGEQVTVSQLAPISEPVFDIPALVGKDMTEIKTIIGKPTGSYSEPTQQQLALDPKTWSSEWDKDGQDLSIEYEVKTLKVIDFFISTDDPSGATKDIARLLKIGNLTKNDPRYAVDFVPAKGDPASYTGVKIVPK